MEGLARVARVAAGLASAVFAEALFQLDDAGLKLGNADFERGQEFADRVDTSFVQSGLDEGAQGFASFGQHHDNAGSRKKYLRFLKYLNGYVGPQSAER